MNLDNLHELINRCELKIPLILQMFRVNSENIRSFDIGKRSRR